MKVVAIWALVVIAAVTAQDDKCACEKKHPQDIFNSAQNVLLIDVQRSLMGNADNAEYLVNVKEKFKSKFSVVGLVFSVHRFCGNTLKTEEKYVVSGTVFRGRFLIENCGIRIPGNQFTKERRQLIKLYGSKGAKCQISTGSFTKPRKNACQIHSDERYAKCQFDYGACVLEQGKCGWAKSAAYEKCIKGL